MTKTQSEKNAKAELTYLYALKSGAVHYEGDRISVSNHLEIDGDVTLKREILILTVL